MGCIFDRIVFAVPDLPDAVAQYERLLGAPAYTPGTPPDDARAWWGLANTVIELVQCSEGSARLQGIVFSAPDAQPDDIPVANSLGLDIRVCDGRATAQYRQSQGAQQDSGLSVDHVVLRTTDAQACIDLFAGEMGLRLALDKTVPQWGGRMLFFRAGKLTLEVIESTEDTAGQSTFWGLAYQCADLPAFIEALAGRGVAASEARDGRKPGTRVATLKSDAIGIPTLLIQPAK